MRKVMNDMFLGIDIGSTSSKAVIIDGQANICSRQVVNSGTGTPGAAQVVAAALAEAGCAQADILYCVATGYGRLNYKDANRQITEISCHAKGVSFAAPHARTVVDIGGQDTKVIRLDGDGNVANFVMNDKCAAGTGRFLEVMARVLGCEIGQLSGLAMKAAKPAAISSICTVFAESEAISKLADNVAREDVAAGAMVSIGQRVAGMAARVGVAEAVIMTGGVALNRAMLGVLADEFQVEVTTTDSPQIVGALGAAVFAMELYKKTTK